MDEEVYYKEIYIADGDVVPVHDNSDVVYLDEWNRPVFVFRQEGYSYFEIHYTYESDPDDE